MGLVKHKVVVGGSTCWLAAMSARSRAWLTIKMWAASAARRAWKYAQHNCRACASGGVHRAVLVFGRETHPGGAVAGAEAEGWAFTILAVGR